MSALVDTAMAVALLSLVFCPLEWAFAARSVDFLKRPGLALDATFLLGNYLVWGGLSVAALEWLADHLGGLPLSTLRRAFGAQPLWAQAVELVLLSDLSIYWFHRACHAWPPLWRIHRVHHTAEHLDWVAAHREHPLDGFSSQLVLNLPALALGFRVELIGTFFVFRGLWSVFIHSNVRVPLGPLRWLLGAPEVHAWHHAKHPGRVMNFANVAPWCDLLFGTYHCPSVHETWALGVDEPVRETYAALLLDPLHGVEVHERAEHSL